MEPAFVDPILPLKQRAINVPVGNRPVVIWEFNVCDA